MVMPYQNELGAQNNIKEKGLEGLNNLPTAMRKEMLKNLATIAEHLPDDVKLQILKELRRSE
jgi:hypothetical protein